MNIKEAIEGPKDILDGCNHTLSTSLTEAFIEVDGSTPYGVALNVVDQVFRKSDLIELRDLLTAIIEDGRIK